MVEIQDGIANNLAGTVIGDVAAAIGFAKFDTLLTENVFGGEQILLAGIAPERDDMRMLAEEKNIINGGSLLCGHEAFLQGVGVRPGDEAKVTCE